MSVLFSMLLARWNWLLSVGGGEVGGGASPQTPPGYGPDDVIACVALPQDHL